MYIPPSQYKTGYTSNGEYYAFGSPYYGPYYILKNGSAFSGVNPSDPETTRLTLPYDIKSGDDPFGDNEYKTDSNDAIVSLSHQLPRSIPKPYLPSITEQSKKKNYIHRYYLKRNDVYQYMEIDEPTYYNFDGQSPDVAWDLYDYAKLRWYIDGESEDVQNANISSVISIQEFQSSFNQNGKNWVGFQFIFNQNWLQFYQGIQENLSTSGGKYKTSDGKEYIGLYHIHPEKGPMVGATHISTPHDYLFPLNRPIPPVTPISQQPQELPTQQSSTGGNYSSGGGSFGGGGGGGY